MYFIDLIGLVQLIDDWWWFKKIWMYNIYVEYCSNQTINHMIIDHIKISKIIIFTSKKNDNIYEDRIICLNICSTMVLNSSYKK